VVAGDLGALETILSSKQDIFVRSGVLITMEKLRLVTLRNFVRRVAAAVKSDPDL
jgi:myosin heavy subunit